MNAKAVKPVEHGTKKERVAALMQKHGPDLGKCTVEADKEGFTFSTALWATVKKEQGLTRAKKNGSNKFKATQSSWEERYDALIAVGGIAAVTKSLKALERVEADLAVIERLGGRDSAKVLIDRVKAMFGTEKNQPR